MVCCLGQTYRSIIEVAHHDRTVPKKMETTTLDTSKASGSLVPTKNVKSSQSDSCGLSKPGSAADEKTVSGVDGFITYNSIVPTDPDVTIGTAMFILVRSLPRRGAVAFEPSVFIALSQSGLGEVIFKRYALVLCFSFCDVYVLETTYPESEFGNSWLFWLYQWRGGVVDTL